MTHETNNIDCEIYGIDDVTDVLSPGLLIYLDLVKTNIDEMVRIAGGANRLCPHCKTHKTREIIKLMRESGITHHKCATIAEAEMLASVGVKEVLIAYQLVGPNLKRLFTLQDKFPNTRFMTIADNPLVVEQMSEASAQRQTTIPLLIDLETAWAERVCRRMTTDLNSPNKSHLHPACLLMDCIGTTDKIANPI